MATEWWGTAVAVIAPFFLPNSVVQNGFFVIGRAFSILLRQKAGPVAEKRIEGYFIGTIDAATTGLKRGMDEHNSEAQ